MHPGELKKVLEHLAFHTVLHRRDVDQGAVKKHFQRLVNDNVLETVQTLVGEGVVLGSNGYREIGHKNKLRPSATSLGDLLYRQDVEAWLVEQGTTRTSDWHKGMCHIVCRQGPRILAARVSEGGYSSSWVRKTIREQRGTLLSTGAKLMVVYPRERVLTKMQKNEAHLLEVRVWLPQYSV